MNGLKFFEAVFFVRLACRTH